jgi:hypothetical protein
MKRLIAALLICLSAPAFSMQYFLVSQWLNGINRMCEYGDGSVLNVGVGSCPYSIEH